LVDDFIAGAVKAHGIAKTAGLEIQRQRLTALIGLAQHAGMNSFALKFSSKTPVAVGYEVYLGPAVVDF